MEYVANDTKTRDERFHFNVQEEYKTLILAIHKENIHVVQ